MNDPRWTRRKAARPAEIVEAATEVFIQAGYANANLDDVARRAGIAKGTLYRYFDDKESLFRAVVQQAIAENLAAFGPVAGALDGALGELVPRLLRLLAGRPQGDRATALARMVIAQSQAFPDLASIWHDHVASRVLALLTGLIRRAQERGEVRPGDPAAHAFSIVGPVLAALMFREVFGTASPHLPDLERLAGQHAQTVLRGLLAAPGAGD